MTDQERLEELRTWLGAIDVNSEVLEKSEAIPLDVLLADLSDDADNERMLQFAFLPISSEDLSFTKLLQAYMVLNHRATDENLGEILYLIKEANSKSILGHFGIGPDNEIYYRYVHSMSTVLNDEVGFQEMFSMIFVSIKMFESLLNDLASGKVDLEASLDQLAQR
ncbi:MAG: hypothetical protein MK078_02295 [Crocinitomicaceae bacterium]|nr:hypothetical protein [Crocinitomicaceae bacterium]